MGVPLFANTLGANIALEIGKWMTTSLDNSSDEARLRAGGSNPGNYGIRQEYRAVAISDAKPKIKRHKEDSSERPTTRKPSPDNRTRKERKEAGVLEASTEYHQ